MPSITNKGFMRSEIVRGSSDLPQNSFYELPIPVPTAVGGLGKSLTEEMNGILVADKGEIIFVKPPDENRIFLGNGWSKHEFILRTDLDLDQNLSKNSKVSFREVTVGDDAGSVKFLAKDGQHTFIVTTDCVIDQRLDKESEPTFAGLHVNGTIFLESGLILGGSQPEKAVKGMIAYENGRLVVHDGNKWTSAEGNVVGAGSGGYLAAWNKEGQLFCTPGLRVDGNYLLFGEKAESIFAAVTLNRVHDETGAALELGGPLLLGMGGKALAGALRMRPDYRPEWSDGKNWYSVGTGDGNVCGRGRQNHLVMWGETDITDAPAKVGPKGIYIGLDFENKSAKYPLHVGGNKQVAQFDGKVGIGEVLVNEKDGKLFINDNEIMLTPKFGKIVLGDGFCNSDTTKSCVIGENLSLSIEKTEEDRYGICLFDKKFFSVKNGKVSFNHKAIGEVSKEESGLMNPQILMRLLNKQDALNFSSIEGDDAISIEGNGYIVGNTIKIKVKKASNSECGIASFSKEFHVDNGNVILNYTEMKYASTESSGLLTKNNFQHFWNKQDKLKFGDFIESEGLTWEGTGKIAHNDIKLKLKYATQTERGIAGFNAEDFNVDKGFVSLKEKNIDLVKEMAIVLKGKQDTLKNPVEGIGKNGFIPIWDDGKIKHTSFIHIEKDNIIFDTPAYFNQAVIIGTTDADAAKLGCGAIRWERGQLEVSNGDFWQPLGGGSLAGKGKNGSIPYFVNESSVNGSEKIFWDEEKASLGIGTEKPSSTLHIALPKARVLISDTSSSSPNAGGTVILESEDGNWLSKGDKLGEYAFAGHGVTGASIRAISEENWGKNTCGTKIIFSTVKNGSIGIIDHMVLSAEGFIGIGNMLPTAPLHVSGNGKSGNTAKFEASIQIGKNDNSASLAGQGSIRFTNGHLQFSNGNEWLSLFSESEIQKLIKENLNKNDTF